MSRGASSCCTVRLRLASRVDWLIVLTPVGSKTPIHDDITDSVSSKEKMALVELTRANFYSRAISPLLAPYLVLTCNSEPIQYLFLPTEHISFFGRLHVVKT